MTRLTGKDAATEELLWTAAAPGEGKPIQPLPDGYRTSGPALGQRYEPDRDLSLELMEERVRKPLQSY